MYRPQNVRALLNLLGSHDTARYLTVAGGDTASLQLALLATDDAARRAVHLLRRRGRHGGPPRPGLPARLPVGPRVAGITICLTSRRRSLRCDMRSPLCATVRFRSLVTTESAVAYGRFGDEGAVVVALNAGDEPCELSFDSDEVRGAKARSGQPARDERNIREPGRLIRHGPRRRSIRRRADRAVTPFRAMLWFLAFGAGIVVLFALFLDNSAIEAAAARGVACRAGHRARRARLRACRVRGAYRRGWPHGTCGR